jgi:hypothetical protein
MVVDKDSVVGSATCSVDCIALYFADKMLDKKELNMLMHVVVVGE